MSVSYILFVRCSVSLACFQKSTTSAGVAPAHEPSDAKQQGLIPSADLEDECRVQLAALQLRRAVRGHAGKTLRLWGALAGIAWYCVQHYTLAHPFLLADNR